VVGFDLFPKFPAEKLGVGFITELPIERFDIVLSWFSVKRKEDVPR
jgi:hypothetical protein